LSADFPRDSLAATGLDERSKFQVSNSREAPKFNVQRKKSRLFFLSNLRIEISLKLGPWDLELCRRRVAWKTSVTWRGSKKNLLSPRRQLSSAPYAEAYRSQQNSEISRETIQNNGAWQSFACAIGPSPPALVEKCKTKASIEQSGAGRQD
jgi:hypothetical protein